MPEFIKTYFVNGERVTHLITAYNLSAAKIQFAEFYRSLLKSNKPRDILEGDIEEVEPVEEPAVQLGIFEI